MNQKCKTRVLPIPLIIITFIIATLAILFAQCGPDKNSKLTIVYPSLEQGTIAPGRDFYVIGNIDPSVTVPADAILTVALKNETGETIRSVSTKIKDNKDGLNIDYPLLSYYGSDRQELKNSCMPDLVYDPNDPDSFADTWIKAYYNDQNFTALIYGGTYDIDINPYDQNGVLLESLPEGNYQIHVTLSNPTINKTLGKVTQKLNIKYADDKILSRFAPPMHFENVLEQAKIHDYTVFLDPFPGFWNPHTFIESLKDSNMFCEILPKWRLADSQEYIQGRVHFYIYNVSATSATYNVEVGQLTYDHAIDDDLRTFYYYYDIGEPELPNGDIKGIFKPFDLDQSFALTRVDYPTGTSVDNYLNISDLADMTSDLELMDGIDVKAGETISLYGVCKPIPSSVTRDSSNKYTIENRISYISYQYIADSTPVEIIRPVMLTRVYPESDAHTQLEMMREGNFNVNAPVIAPSILEFKHDLVFPDVLVGRQVMVMVSALDKDMNAIGNYTTIIIEVEE